MGIHILKKPLAPSQAHYAILVTVCFLREELYEWSYNMNQPHEETRHIYFY